jgi:CRP-like cAMP-binding protein
MPMKTILLIEDDKDVRANTTEILELAQYDVITASDGKQGVALARERLPDLILCDIMMPELDGYSVLHLLNRQQRTAEIPFIFISGKAEASDVRKGMEQGADDYLVKPYKESELLNAIAGRLKRRDVFNHQYPSDLNGLNAFLEDARGLSSLSELRKDRPTRTLGPKEFLFHEGDRLQDVFFIDKGKVRAYRSTEDGKELVTGLHASGDFVGYMNALQGGLATETAETTETTVISWIPVNDLVTLLHRDRDVAIRFIKMLTHDVREKEEQLVSLAYGTVRQRIAQALLRLRDRYGTGATDESIQISREDLANMAGTATESVIRSLSDLKAEGFIELKGRGIRIRNEKGVERLASL